MKPDRTTQGRTTRRLLGCVCLLASVAAGGCRFLADEFVYLDRAAPSALVVPDAPVSGLVERP